MNYLCILYFIYLNIVYSYGSESYDQESLKKLTEYRQQHRKTVDGRLCAAAFVQEDRTYSDCTKATDPNGLTGKEWCYVEVQLIGKGNRDWEYCRGVINYDVVRSKARVFFQGKANELSRAVSRLDMESKKLGGIYEKYEQVCGTTSELLKQRIAEINDIAKNSSRNINKLLLLASSMGDTEQEYYELSDIVSKNRQAFVENKKNCSVNKGYTVEEKADGLVGSYYDNAYFSGYPSEVHSDKHINFIWDTGVPVGSIPYQHFSVRWDGYLKVPVTDNYILSVEHDCGVRLFIDYSPVIVDNMPYPQEDEMEENRPIPVLPVEQLNAQVKKSESKELGLTGGKKYKFRLEYFHLSTVKYANPDTAHVILSWRSNNIMEEIIPSQYFYPSNVTPSLRITQLQGDEFEIMSLENGTHAFMDSLSVLIADVPAIHEKVKGIRTFSSFSRNKIQFHVNVYCTVFVAVPPKADVPFNEVDQKNFELTKDSISTYQVESEDSKKPRQEVYSIYSSDYGEGDVVITLKKPSPIIIFVEQNKKKSSNDCKGYVQVLSLTNSVYFDSCYTSSYESEKYDCKAGFSGKNEEKEYSTWITAKGKSLGQYMSINFKQDVEIHSFTFKTLQADEKRVLELTLHFPKEKNPEVFAISPDHHHYKLKKPIRTNTVKAVLSKVNDSKSSSGGNLAFYGLSCVEAKSQKESLEKRNQFEVNILFRSKDVNFSKPIQWQIDNGQLKEKHGIFSYGWQKLPTPIPLELLNKKDLNHAGISFRPVECGTDSCDTSNKWSIDLIHKGMYSVSIEIGSPEGKQELNSLKVNDAVFINDIFLKPNQYTKVTSDIYLKNSTTLEISTNTRTVIQSVQILFLHS